VLVRLQRDVKHLTGFFALLVDQLITYRQQAGEARLDNLVEMRPALAVVGLETVRAADGKEALQTSQNRRGLIGVEQLDSVVHKSRPSVGKVEVQNALENGNELVPHEGL